MLSLPIERLRNVIRRTLKSTKASKLFPSRRLVLSRLERLDHRVEALQREVRLLVSALSLPEAALWTGLARIPPSEPYGGVFPCSCACTQTRMEQPYFAYWIHRLGEIPRYHRKQWEFAFIVQALWERNQLAPGFRGLGFGVGREPLAALFAAHSCQIVATDMAFDRAEETGWMQTAQHAVGKESLRRPDICDDDVFTRNVEFQVCDMNAIDPDLTGFDFCWSACAFEHLGSIEHGLQFVENSLKTLKPGGWAVHTTEFNVSSNEATLDHAATVLFRRRDFEELARRLTARGHQVVPIDFTMGERPMDRYIDVAPYRTDAHLVMALEGYATTSFGLIVQKAV